MKKGGYTLVEVAIVATLGTIVMFKGATLVRDVVRVGNQEMQDMALEDHSRKMMDQITYAIMSSDRESLVPMNTVFPDFETGLTYRLSLGLENGNVVWSDPEWIGLGPNGTQIVWAASPGAADEQRVVWSNRVQALMEGEIPNGLDDNGNGLVDEQGLNFLITGNRVIVRLTLAQVGENGEITEHTIETTATCRN